MNHDHTPSNSTNVLDPTVALSPQQFPMPTNNPQPTHPAFQITPAEWNSFVQKAQAERTWEDALDDTLSRIRANMIRKHRDYGQGNILRHGEPGVIVRTDDKLARLQNLVMGNKTPQNEAIADSWLDVVGYGIIGMMLREGTFQLPLAETAHSKGE